MFLVTSALAIEEDGHKFFARKKFQHCAEIQFGFILSGQKIIFIADRQTKVVKLVTGNTRYCPNGMAICFIILISSYLLPLSIWIQITIHPLSTDGAIVI